MLSLRTLELICVSGAEKPLETHSVFFTHPQLEKCGAMVEPKHHISPKQLTSYKKYKFNCQSQTNPSSLDAMEFSILHAGEAV